MDEADDPRPTHVPPVIESASATTSPDNARSGPLAYVVTALIVGLLALFTLSFSSCMSAVGQIATSWECVHPDDYGYDYYDYYGDDANELYGDSRKTNGPLDVPPLPTSPLDSSPTKR